MTDDRRTPDRNTRRSNLIRMLKAKPEWGADKILELQEMQEQLESRNEAANYWEDNWRDWFERYGDENLVDREELDFPDVDHYHITVGDLYEAFKARFLAELLTDVEGD